MTGPIATNLQPVPNWSAGQWQAAQGGTTIGAGATYQDRTAIRSTVVTPTAGQPYAQVVGGIAQNVLGVAAGTTVRVSADIFLSSPRKDAFVTFLGRDAPNNDSYAVTFDPSTPQTQYNLTQGAWMRLSWLVTVNAGRTLTMIYFRGYESLTGADPGTAGAYVDVARVMVTADYPPDYFDGDSPDAKWTGAPNASPSVLYNVTAPVVVISPITCEVTVDGTRLADTAEAWQMHEPVALDGLHIQWGRDGPQSQPDLASCTLTVADADGDAEFLGLLHVGAVLEVNASSQIDTGGAPSDVTVDGGFATDLTLRVDATPDLTVTDDPAHDAISAPGHSVKLTASSTTVFGSVYVPPAPFTTAPGGWGAIPTFDPASPEWTVSLMVRGGPVAMGLYWELTGFAESTKSAPRTPIGGQITFDTSAGPSGSYVTVGGPTLDPTSASVWLGIRIGGVHRVAYADCPVAQTYDGTGAGSYADCDCVWLDELSVMAPSVTTRRATVFSGRITDLAASAMGAAVSVEITASDWAADLANQNIGDQPWLAERLDARASRIVGYAPAAGRPAVYVDPRPAALPVSWLDVDNQPLYGLLSDLATSGDALLWPMRVGELWFEDPATRASVGTLGLDSGSGLVTVTGGRPSGGIALDSCEVLRDELTLEQNVEDVLTRVALTWLDQTLDETGNMQPTETSLYADDTTAQGTLGVRELSVSTLLTTAADGQTVADNILARARSDAWHAKGLTWDTRLPAPFTPEDRAAALTALDMKLRVGLLVTVTDTPAWVPLGPTLSAFLEGGSYTFTGGRWSLELSLSPSSVSGKSCTYAELPTAWTYALFDPAVSYLDLWGVSVDA